MPYAYQAIQADNALHSDTAEYAHVSPGGAATGWVDDGSVVRLSSSGDRVGIGTSSPGENLVVGGDLGSFPEANYVVSGNSNFEEYSGFKLGYNADNHATINWHGDGDQLSFHTRSLGTDYNNSLVLRSGLVGINNDYPQEPLAIGPSLGSYYGDFVQMARIGSWRYSGFMCGEDENNRGTMMWINNTNEFRLGGKYDGVDYGATMTLKEGNVGIGTTAPAGLLHVAGPALDATVQLPTGSISNIEIANEAGGVGSYEVDSWENILPGLPPVVIDSCIIDAPATGIVVAFATASVWASFMDESFHFGISKSSSIGRYVEIQSNSSWTAKVPVTVVDYFVVSAGETIFYFLAERPGEGIGGGTAYNPLIFTIYLPTTYNASASSDEGLNVGDEFESSFVEPRTAESFKSALSAPGSVEALRAEFNAKLKALEKEFTRKLNELKRIK